MARRYGLDLETMLGRFMAVSAAVLAGTVIVLATASTIESHYRFPSPRIANAVHAAPAPPPGTLIWLSTFYGPDDKRLVRVAAAGDVMMGSIDRGLNPDITPGVDAADLVGQGLTGIFRKADIAFANLEGPLYDGPERSAKDCERCFSFHSPPYYADVLTSLHLTVVSLANNHSGDFGPEGRATTMAELSKRHIAFGGLDRDGARYAELTLKDGRKAAVIAFAPNSGTLDINDIAAAAARVRALKANHVVVIVSFHGGGEGWDRVHVVQGHEIFAGEDRGHRFCPRCDRCRCRSRDWSGATCAARGGDLPRPSHCLQLGQFLDL